MSRSSAGSAGGSGVGLRIWLLGGFRVEVGARVIADSDWRLQKARGLVKLLALAPHHRLGREAVMERLWPEAEPEAALNNFYYALHVARRALDRHMPDKTAHASVLRLVAGVLALAPGRSLCIDVEAFRTAATGARQSRDPSAYRRAINLYDGELRPEDPYADWATRPREELRDEHVVLLLELARVHQERRENAETIVVLTQLVNVEPTCEDACSTLPPMARQQARRTVGMTHAE